MKLTIITINLNNAAGLRKTIESVASQTFKDYEYIIIDGGSTDSSLDIIMGFSEKITCWISEPDKGIYNAMNKGILKASGEYLQFLNSGDCFVDEDVLSSFFIENDNTDILFGNVNHVSSQGDKVLFVMPQESEVSLAFFLQKNITHQAAVIRKELFQDSLYDENFRIFSDWKFFIQKIILENCSIRNINKTVINYDNGGISSNPEQLKLHAKERNEILSGMFPDRVLIDYKMFLLAKNSTLLKHLPFLNKTKRFQKLVAGVVGGLIKIYKCFRFFIKGKI